MGVERPHSVKYAGPLPGALYRYRSLSAATVERVFEFEILGEGIYLSSLRQLNDPDEGRFLVRFPQDSAAIERFWRVAVRSTNPSWTREQRVREARLLTRKVIEANYVPPAHVESYTRHVIENVFRVACFTTLATNFSMWANYAKYTNEAGESTDHAGICIRYACDSRWSTVGLHPVDYTDEVPVVDPTERDEEKFARVMYTKAREWRCESEWRVSSILKAMPPFAPDFDKNSKIRGEGMVSGVIFGMRTPPEIKKKFVKRIVSSGRNVELLQLTRNPSTFARELAPCPP